MSQSNSKIAEFLALKEKLKALSNSPEIKAEKRAISLEQKRAYNQKKQDALAFIEEATAYNLYDKFVAELSAAKKAKSSK